MPWSAWHDAFDYDFPVSPTNYVASSQVTVRAGYPGAIPATDVLDGQSVLQDGLGDWRTAAAIPFQVAGFGFRVETGGGDGDYTLSAAYEAANFDATALEGLPPQLFPSDFPWATASPIPPELQNDATFEGTVQYESASCELLAWEDATISDLLFRFYTNDGAGNPAYGPADPGPVAFTPPATTPFRISKASSLAATGPAASYSPFTGSPYYLGPPLTAADLISDLTELDPNTLSSHVASYPYTDDGSGTTNDSTNLDPITLSTSGIADPTFALVCTCGYSTDVAIPLTGADAVPGSDRGYEYDGQLFADPNHNGNAGPLYSAFAALQVPGRFRAPRWRYWIADAIYTIGGHWSDPNGVQVMRLKDDGVTWIPIVDGLAPGL